MLQGEAAKAALSRSRLESVWCVKKEVTQYCVSSRQALVAPKSDTKHISKLRRDSEGVGVSLGSGSARRDAQGRP